MLGLTPIFARLRAAGAALMPSAVIALGMMGGAAPASGDVASGGSSSRTGTVLRYRLDVAQIRPRWLRNLQTGVRRILRDESIAHAGVTIAEDRVRVALRDPGKQEQAANLLATLALPVSPKGFGTAYNLTVKGGEDGAIWIEPTPEGLSGQVEGALLRSVEVIRRRMDPEGSENAAVSPEGQDGIVVEFAGLDASEAKARIAVPGRLTLQLVDETMAPEAARAKGVPPEDQLLPEAKHPGHYALVHKEVLAGGDRIVNAYAQDNPYSRGAHEKAVNFDFDLNGAAAFARVTRENTGKVFAIVLDGTVLSAPRIVTEMPSGHGLISANFKPGEAERLALVLRSGALPAPLLLVEERTIELTGRRRE